MCGLKQESDQFVSCFFFLMIRRPPRSTLDRSSAASDVYKRQHRLLHFAGISGAADQHELLGKVYRDDRLAAHTMLAVSYTHLRAHETVLDLVCRLLLEKKNTTLSSYSNRRNDRSTLKCHNRGPDATSYDTEKHNLST